MSLVSTRNFDHWRFQVSDIWDQIRGFDSDRSGEIPWRNFYGTAEVYVLKLGASYWGVPEIPVLPPELGGVAIGNTFRTSYSLKGSLVLLDEMSSKDYLNHWRYMYVTKEMFSFVPEYRPWVKMPHGPTKDLMSTLGKYSGLHNELESFGLKAHNKFVIDTTWYKCKFWDLFAKKLADKLSVESIKIDFWDWAMTKEWPTFAIPKSFVRSDTTVHSEQDFIPFVRIQKERPKYSLPSMMVSFMNYFKWGNPLSEIAPLDLDFSAYLQWETPILTNQGSYEPICDMELTSQIASFSDPRRTYLDYWFRNKTVITGLYTPDHKSNAALDLLLAIDPDLKDWGYDKATWYTKYPVPYKSEWINILSKNFPDKHQEIILELIKNPEDYNNPQGAIFLTDDFDNHRKQNSKFWKEKTRSKKRGQQKRKTLLEHKTPRQLIDDTEELSLLNTDDIRQVMDQIWLDKQPKLDITEAPVEQPGFQFDLQWVPPDPEWLEDLQPQVEEEDYYPEEEDENSLLEGLDLDSYYRRQDSGSEDG